MLMVNLVQFRIAGFISFVIYMVTTFALYVPDWSFTVDQDHERRRYTVWSYLLNRSMQEDVHWLLLTKTSLWSRLVMTWLQVECGMRGHLGPACNAVGYVDREVWGINHLYQYPVWSRLKVSCDSSRVVGGFVSLFSCFQLVVS
jgi:heparan-alpha-glucosaminide N-acetyltransferase